jgi:hypothetical protein
MKKTLLLLALFSLIVLAASCAKGEEITISKYFEAMKLNDKDTLATMAIEPKDIEYKKYEVVSIDEPVISELELPILEKKLEALRAERKKQIDVAMDKKFAMEDIQDELDDTRRRSKKAELQNKLDEAKAEYDAQAEVVKGVMMKINRMKKAISREKTMIKASTGVDRNYNLYTGETHKSKAIVKVTKTDGSSEDFVFMLRKNVLKLQDTPRPGRLIITKLVTVAEFEKEQQQAEEEEKTVTQEVTEEKPAADTATEGETNQ